MNAAQQPDRQASGAQAYRWIVVALLVVAVGVALYLRSDNSDPSLAGTDQELAQAAGQDPAEVDSDAAMIDGALPRLVDLGADKCVPCKLMAPILVELRREFANRFEVVFIDVWKNRAEGQKYGIKVIPTQIFFDARGKELFRHEGFFSREDILKTWREHGFDFGKSETSMGSS